MKLWEIKAQALRLMFADYDMQFSEQEFAEQVVYNNYNTREKLIRMEDSINRAIDNFYNIVGETTKTKLVEINPDNTLDLTEIINDLSRPIRVDWLLFDNYEQLRYEENNLDFYYEADVLSFLGKTYTDYIERSKFRVWYKEKRKRLPVVVAEMEFDLNDINIPTEVQQMIPYYIKGELYEEDEADVAAIARQRYIEFLYNLQKKITVRQTKVKSAKVFKK